MNIPTTHLLGAAVAAVLLILLGKFMIMVGVVGLIIVIILAITRPKKGDSNAT